MLDTRPYDPSGTNANLVEVSAIKCRELRKLFDARGKRVLDDQRAAEAAEAKRKAKAAAFRAAYLARGAKLAPSSSSSDDEGEVGEEKGDKGGRKASTAKAVKVARVEEGVGEGGEQAAEADGPTQAAKQTKAGIEGESKARLACSKVAQVGRKEAVLSATSANYQPPSAAGPLPPPPGSRQAKPHPKAAVGSLPAPPRPPPRATWGLYDLGALAFSASVWGVDVGALAFSADYLFVYKQHDLHMDHPTEAVTLATQVGAAWHT